MTTVHPQRYSTTGVSLCKLGVVIHDSESPDGSAGSLLRFLEQPGDRLIAGSNPPRYYGSSYHAITLNRSDAYEQVLGREAGPFHAPPLNKSWWGICIPGYARQTRDEWLDPASLSGIRAVAKFIIDKAAEDGFPLEFVNASGLVGGRRGYTCHAEVSKAWGQTNHTDPGSFFPWDVLAIEIDNLTAPPPITPEPPTEEQLIMSGSFSIIARNAGALAFVSKGPAGTDMTGLSAGDVSAVQAGFAAANGGAVLPVVDVSASLWQSLFNDALVSKGYAKGVKLADGSFVAMPNQA